MFFFYLKTRKDSRLQFDFALSNQEVTRRHRKWFRSCWHA